MDDLYKLFQKLDEKNIPFCYQSQSASKFYNLAIKDIKGKSHYIHSENLKEVEAGLKILWGHLLKPTIPVPAGFPTPN